MSSLYRLYWSSDSTVLRRRVEKALLSSADEVLVCAQWSLRPDWSEYSSLLAGNKKLSFYLEHEVLQGLSAAELLQITTQGEHLVVALSPDVKMLSGHIETLYAFREKVSALYRFSRKFDVREMISYIPVWLRERLYFEPDSRLPGKLIYQTGRQIVAHFPEIKFRPLPGLDQFDSRIPDEVPLGVSGEEALSMNSQDPQVQISIVIPCHESHDFLINCVRHLLLQDFPRDRFEIIVVDDGSVSPATDMLLSFLAPEAGQLNFRYFYLPKKTVPGEVMGSFRAGACRNYGVEESCGEIVSFLDSDMLVPSGYLELVARRLESVDLIQFVRFHIKPAKSHRWTSLKELDPEDCYIEESNYWGPFFSSSDWMSVPDCWKYVCTYSLSMKRSVFRRLGGFRKTYVSYGFEDTDLGYTAFQQNLRFYLEKEPLYHLTPFSEKARYRHSMYYKHRLLKVTAKTFFVNHLSPEIYEKLRSLLD